MQHRSWPLHFEIKMPCTEDTRRAIGFLRPRLVAPPKASEVSTPRLAKQILLAIYPRSVGTWFLQWAFLACYSLPFMASVMLRGLALEQSPILWR